jgi:hypothetical protein
MKSHKPMKLVAIIAGAALLAAGASLWLFSFGGGTRGNTVGNIANYGLVAQQGGMVYYSVGGSDGRLYSINTEGFDGPALE